MEMEPKHKRLPLSRRCDIILFTMELHVSFVITVRTGSSTVAKRYDFVLVFATFVVISASTQFDCVLLLSNNKPSKQLTAFL